MRAFNACPGTLTAALFVHVLQMPCDLVHDLRNLLTETKRETAAQTERAGGRREAKAGRKR